MAPNSCNEIMANGSIVQCKILHSLSNMIVVSLETPDKKLFQGALLQAPTFLCMDKMQENNPRDYKLESYFNSSFESRHSHFTKKLPPKRHIRLRARQVLCHQCKNVCSENGKNVRKSHQKRNQFNDLCVKTFTLVPKLKRLRDNEIQKFNKIHAELPNCDIQDKDDLRKLTPLKIRILPPVAPW